MKISIVIPASGVGLRFGGKTPKQFLDLNGEPILKRTLSVFDSYENVFEIIVAANEEYFSEIENYKISKLKHIVEGKETRGQSVFSALKAVSQEADIVLVHDGIRPFATHEIIEAVALTALKHGAAVACSPVTDTIKQADANGKIITTPDRNLLWQAQTPQGFKYETIMRIYTAAEKDGILEHATDDSFLAERLNIAVHIVKSSPSNIKITTQTDLTTAKMLLEEIKTTETAKPAKKIIIYTDGACSGNPGPGGYGAVLVYGDIRKEICGGEKQTTNNRMEIMAVLKALELIKKPSEIEIYSDSQYVINSIEKGWAKKWQKNNWKRNKNEPALNADLWETLLELLDKHKVTFHWVKGHSGHAENERCDELARSQIMN